MSICIPEEFLDGAEAVVERAKGSLERIEGFTELFGGNKSAANEINTLYEKKLLLKNQDDIIEKFIDDINGISLGKKEELKISIKERLANRTAQIQDEELLSIVKEISDKKYGIEVTPEQAKVINQLQSEGDILKTSFEKQKQDLLLMKDKIPESEYLKLENKVKESGMEYGRKVSDQSDYIGSLINPEESFNVRNTIRNTIKTTSERFGKEKGPLGNISEGVSVATDVLTSPIYKSVQASMDFSMALRQGLKVLAYDPKVWGKNIVEAFKPFREVFSKDKQNLIFRDFKARLVSSDLYQKALDSKLGIGVIEEFFPTALAEKFPIIGNIFKASNLAFTIFSQGARMDLFKSMVEHAVREGAEMTPQLYKDFALMANSISGRGGLGSFEAASGVINKIFYSGRFISSQLDTFTKPFTLESPLAKRVALKSSLRTFGMIGSLMATASLFTEVEIDPRSSKFGKMKIPGSKDTWVDLTGGLGSYIVAASRVATLSSKSSITGKITKLNTGKFGAKTAQDIVFDFLSNKLSPAPAIGMNYLKGKDFSGNKPTIGSSMITLGKPISLGNAIDIFQNEEASTALLATMFDLLGAGQTNYEKFKK
jgi:hypothetical protein